MAHIPPFLAQVAADAVALGTLVPEAERVVQNAPMAFLSQGLALAGAGAHHHGVAVTFGLLAQSAWGMADGAMRSTLLIHRGPMGLAWGTWNVLLKRLFSLPLTFAPLSVPMDAQAVSDGIDARAVPTILAPYPSFFADAFLDPKAQQDGFQVAATAGCNAILQAKGGFAETHVGLSEDATFLVACCGHAQALLLHATFTRVA